MKDLTCIVCPVGCRIAVEEKDGELVITGNSCPRGYEHAKNEYTDPKRMLTTTVKVEGGVLPRIPVISTAEIPKRQLGECLAQLYQLKVTAPVAYGDIIVKDILGTGVDIKASREMPAKAAV